MFAKEKETIQTFDEEYKTKSIAGYELPITTYTAHHGFPTNILHVLTCASNGFREMLQNITNMNISSLTERASSAYVVNDAHDVTVGLTFEDDSYNGLSFELKFRPKSIKMVIQLDKKHHIDRYISGRFETLSELQTVLKRVLQCADPLIANSIPRGISEDHDDVIWALHLMYPDEIKTTPASIVNRMELGSKASRLIFRAGIRSIYDLKKYLEDGTLSLYTGIGKVTLSDIQHGLDVLASPHDTNEHEESTTAT